MERFYYTLDEDGLYSIRDHKLGHEVEMACTENLDHATMIVRALNACMTGPFSLSDIPECVTKEIF